MTRLQAVILILAFMGLLFVIAHKSLEGEHVNIGVFDFYSGKCLEQFGDGLQETTCPKSGAATYYLSYTDSTSK